MTMLKGLKQRLTDYTDSLTMYDYAAFGWLLFLLVILILLALLSSKKKPKLAVSLIFLTFILMFTAPIGIKIFLDKSVRKVEIQDQNSTLLNFSKALVVTGKLYNLGKIDMTRCYIKTKILKQTDNKYLNILYNLKPIRQRTTILDENLTQNSSKELKVVFEKFNYQKEYRVTLFAECY
ncbi:MAG TPA: DUF2393 domain-containing protein [Campylobacterales bacterium]|nr:DUF2393 domain-containing protein [Campylobacterales bacterium]HIP60603.1 DUF2393 domain-containing protein [Campylobacterales bacterium]